MLDFLKPIGTFLSLTIIVCQARLGGVYSYSWKLKFSQLAEVVNGQNFVQVFLPFCSLKPTALHIIGDNKTEWTSEYLWGWFANSRLCLLGWNFLSNGLLCSPFYLGAGTTRASLVAQLVKTLPAMWETWVWSLGWKDLLEKGMAAHSSIMAWRIPWIVVLGVAKSQTGLSDFHFQGPYNTVIFSKSKIVPVLLSLT